LENEIAPYSTVLFDGHCNLCSGSVKFIVRRDPQRRFRFAPLQSAIGAEIVERFGRESRDLSSILLLEGDRLYDRSSAALRIARGLRFLWPILSVGLLIPAPIRDWIYSWIARNRYRWFGKTEACMMPTDDLRARFLSDVQDDVVKS